MSQNAPTYFTVSITDPRRPCFTKKCEKEWLKVYWSDWKCVEAYLQGLCLISIECFPILCFIPWTHFLIWTLSNPSQEQLRTRKGRLMMGRFFILDLISVNSHWATSAASVASSPSSSSQQQQLFHGQWWWWSWWCCCWCTRWRH